MFIFQSSKDKQLKKIIDTKFTQAISSQTKYESNKQIIANYCSSSDKKSVQKFVNLVKETIKDDDQSPKKKYYAIKMLQDVMKTKNNTLGNYVVKKILKRLGIFAEYKKESKDEKRGETIFGKVSAAEEKYAGKFHLTVLSCLEEWGTTWPKGIDGPHLTFKEKYQELMKSKVTFPKTINNAPQVLKQKISKDKVDTSGFNRPKKFISPGRRESREKRDEQFNSGNIPQPLTEKGIVDINTFMLNIDEKFSFLEECVVGHQATDTLKQVVDALRKEMNDGDKYVAELTAQNNPKCEPVINDIISDFEFIEEISDRIRELEKDKTGRGRGKFQEDIKGKLEERKKRRSRNELRTSIIDKQVEKNRSFEGNNSVNSRRSEDGQPNFYYPQGGEMNRQGSTSEQRASVGRSVTAEDIKRRAESSRESEKSRKQSGSEEVEDQPTGKFKIFRPQEATANQDREVKDPTPKKGRIPLPPKQPGTESQKGSESGSMNNSSAVPTPPPIKRQIQNPFTLPPSQPQAQAPASSSQNIHSTSIMKKVDSSHLINQSSNSNSNSKEKSAFSNSQKSNPFKSNPFQSNNAIKKQFEDSNMFSSFGKASMQQSSKNQGNSKSKQPVYGRIQQNIYDSEENLSDRKKVSLIGNPFDGDSIFSIQKQRTNPFDISLDQQSNVSNPFSTKKSFQQKSNPFLSDSLSFHSSQQNPIQPSNNLDKSNMDKSGFDRSVFDKSAVDKSMFDKSIFDKNNSNFSNIFTKKGPLDLNFDIQQEQKKLDTSELNKELKESDFTMKKSLKVDFFDTDPNEVDPVVEGGNKNNPTSFFDEFNGFNQGGSKQDQELANIKISNILTKKDMTASNLEFNWLDPGKKVVTENVPFQIPIQEDIEYPDFNESVPKATQEEDKNFIGFNQFLPPQIDMESSPKQSRISQPPKDVTNLWPQVDDLNISQFPPQQQPQTSLKNSNQFQNPMQKLTFQNSNLQNSGLINQQSKRSKQSNPFGVPNPQFQNSTFQKQPRSPNQFQMPTTDKDQFILDNFRTAVQSGGSAWNPYKKKPTSASPDKSRAIFKFQLNCIKLQLKQSKQIYQNQQLTNKRLQQQVLSERMNYNGKLKQMEAINGQKEEYQNLIKKSKETIFIQEAKIAQESKVINRLRALKEKRNNCLKRLFELRNQRYSVKPTGKLSHSSSKVNKFIAFNETAKRLNSQATSQRHLSGKETAKGGLLHHKY